MTNHGSPNSEARMANSLPFDARNSQFDIRLRHRRTEGSAQGRASYQSDFMMKFMFANLVAAECRRNFCAKEQARSREQEGSD